MTEDFRLECLRLAVGCSHKGQELETARKFYDFVRGAQSVSVGSSQQSISQQALNNNQGTLARQSIGSLG